MRGRNHWTYSRKNNAVPSWRRYGPAARGPKLLLWNFCGPPGIASYNTMLTCLGRQISSSLEGNWRFSSMDVSGIAIDVGEGKASLQREQISGNESLQPISVGIGARASPCGNSTIMCLSSGSADLAIRP